MPSKTLPEQNGNSCAAHCTAISIMEITNQSITQSTVEDNLWPSIQFKARDMITTHLASQKNSDPRLIVSEVKKRWPKVNAKLVCDTAQKNRGITYVASGQRPGLETLFTMLTHDAATSPVVFDEYAFYNCSYTMHNAASPSSSNFTGLHNILVTYEGGKVYYYNPNESHPAWKVTRDWKKLENQNSGSGSYVFTGVAVVIS